MTRGYPFLSLVLLVTMGAAVLAFRAADHSYLPTPEGVLTDLVLDPRSPARLLAVSPRGVYLQQGKGMWKRALVFPEHTGTLRQLIPHPASDEKIFLVTDQEVLEGDLKSGKCKRIFGEPSGSKNRIHAMALHPRDSQQIYLGTDEGLFMSGDGGETWLQSFRWPENKPIQLVAFLPTDPPLFLLGTSRELFFSRDGGETLESGFSLPLPKESEELIDENHEKETPLPRRFTSFAFSPTHPFHLWIGTLEGIFESRDGGVVWEKVPEGGLENRQILDLVFSDHSGLISASSRGVARFRPGERRWEVLPLGLAQSPAALALKPAGDEGEEALLVATGGEVLKWILDPLETGSSPSLFLPSPDRAELFKKWTDREPPIREIQKAAIRYASLGNGKIERWHWGSRMRALIPRLSFGKTFSIGNNVDIDRAGTNNPDVFIEGPPDVNNGWNAGVTWELGDLLYSSAQTSIDSRAKLLVELRESILSEVTRLYFERRRVQTEMMFGAEKKSEDFWDLRLRLDELTAQIDALTDGFLSQKLELIYRDDPELRQIYSMPPEDSHAPNSSA